MSVRASDKKQLGQQLRMLREQHKPYISQRKLAQAVDITNASLSDIENGVNFPSEDVFLRLLSVLGPDGDEREMLLNLYADAKQTVPPDITAFLRKQQNLYAVLRSMMGKEITEDAVNYMMSMSSQLAQRV